MQFLTHHYEPWVVAQSVAIASFACFVAINLASRAAVPGTARARAWWIGGSVALGSGIWAMHFVGMMAFSLPIALGFAPLQTGLSAVAAVAVSALALKLAVRPGLTLTRLWLGAATMGGGIAVMHYTGMAALDMAPGIVWDPTLVAASIAVAVVASGAALHILRWLRAVDLERNAGRRALAALVMGLAICAMHYTGMAAASFPVGSVCLSAGVLAGSSLGWLLASAAVGLLVLTLVTSMVDAAAQTRIAQHAAALSLAEEANENAQRELAHERELRASQAFLDQTGRIGGVGGWSFEIADGTMVWTDQTCRIHGYAPGHRPTVAEAVGAFAAEARPGFEVAVRASIISGTGFDLELPFNTKDGRALWVRIVAEAEVDAGRTLRLIGALQDITARRAMESELRRNGELLTSVLEHIPCGLSAYDADLNFLASNTAYRRLTGLPDELVDRPGATYDDVMRFNVARGEHDADYAEMKHRKLVAAACGPQQAFGLEGVRPDGTILEIRGAPIPGGGVVLTHNDITARRAMESELRHKRDLLTSVLEHIPCGLSAYDADLKLMASNTAYRRLNHLPDELVDRPGVTFNDLMQYNVARGECTPEMADAALRTVTATAQAPQRAFAVDRTRPDGTTIEVRGAPIPGGGLVLTHGDITARYAAEQALQRQTERLRLAADSAGIGIWEHDPASGTVTLDDWMHRIYGRAPTDEVLTLDDWAAHMLHPDDAEGVLRDLQGALAGGNKFRPEFRICRPDGQVRYVQAAAHVQFDAEGRAQRITGVNIDVTDERLAEQALREAKLAAESANVAKGQFLANMSHEIRTPMNAVLGMLKLLRRTELTPRQAEYAAKTDGAARALLRLIDDILDFSKADAGKMTLEPRPFRPDTLLRELSVVLSANLGAKDVDLLFDIDPALPAWMVGDAMRLTQVLINLGGNAIKFTAAGEVVLSLAVVGQGADGVTLEIAVRDTGIGIAPENQARIFSGFTQAEASTTRRFGGTGLGLAISQRLVALMGGTLALDSAPGEGSRFHFRITLPVPAAEQATGHPTEPMTASAATSAFASATASAAASATAAATTPVAAHLLGAASADASHHAAGAVAAAPLRALLVDDNPQARAVLERLGRSLGWTIDVADDGEGALALLQARAAAGTPCEAVFVDAQMPGMDGWRTCERIREIGAAGADSNAPIILMLTAHAREAISRRSPEEQALADAFVVKPVTASMLVDALVDARSAKAQPHPSRPAAGRVAVPSRRLEGLRLLLTEDNLNNQQVARELLEDEGAVVQIADHGQAAVTLLRDAADSTFDVVLMDLQMPVMDGYTATRTIRQELGLRALPIVAMTANAMASDRDACLEAGMDDHVAKPFDLDHLVRVLRRHARRPLPNHDAGDPGAAPAGAPVINPAGAGALPASVPVSLPAALPTSTSDATAPMPAASSAPAPLPAVVVQAAAAAGVDIDAALRRLGGKRPIYRRMLGNFVADLATLPAQLTAAQDDRPQVARLLHTCKGLAASLGEKALAAAAALAEKQLAGAVDRAQADAVVAVACDAIRSAAPGLDAVLRALQADADADAEQQALQRAAPHGAQGAAHPAGVPAGTPPIDAPAFSGALQALAAQLRDADMAATDAMQALRLQAAGGRPNDALHLMDEAIAALDFERALQLCTAMIDSLSGAGGTGRGDTASIATATATASLTDSARSTESEPA